MNTNNSLKMDKGLREGKRKIYLRHSSEAIRSSLSLGIRIDVSCKIECNRTSNKQARVNEIGF